jgi:glyoxylase-like metal-dependent hydrolase (beta-lactamase superfamily II)
VHSEDGNYFLAGDTSYNQQLLLAREPDGVSPRADVTRATIDRILALAAEQPTVYLPSHDPESAQRLAEKSVAGSAGTTSVSAADRQPELVTS